MPQVSGCSSAHGRALVRAPTCRHRHRHPCARSHVLTCIPSCHISGTAGPSKLKRTDIIPTHVISGWRTFASEKLFRFFPRRDRQAQQATAQTGTGTGRQLFTDTQAGNGSHRHRHRQSQQAGTDSYKTLRYSTYGDSKFCAAKQAGPASHTILK